MNNPAITLSDTYWIFFKREEHWVPGDSVSFENIRTITKSGAHIRTISRYFNAVSVEIDDKIDLRDYSNEIMHIQPVRRFVRVPFPHIEKS
ncbi:MAG TPA: hypothetical protein VMZ04_10810, partial [Anaerolineae bacterium]|nr:hypothetical protein [Anaerolineae bacterium]